MLSCRWKEASFRAVVDGAANLPKLLTEKAPAGIFCAESP